MFSSPFFGLFTMSGCPVVTGSPILGEAVQQGYELGPDRLQFLQVMGGEPAQAFLAAASELYKDVAPVVGRSQANHKSSVDEAIDKSDGAVVLQLHSLGQDVDGRFHSCRQAFHCQQQLMLLRLYSCSLRGIFAKAHQSADLITQFRHGLEVRLARHHIYRITIVS
jgi:hypothetical protein